MYMNADQLPAGTILRDFDICIVGAGAAGIAMATRLIGSSKRVLVLSSGLPTDRGRPSYRRQSIYRGTMGEFLQKVDPIFLNRSRLRMYGGTTNHFGFWARPLDEADMQPRPGYRDASWAISLDDLAPYYADAHEFGHFGPYNYEDMAFWEKVLYARCFDSNGDAPLQGAIMHAQYDESLHDFQVQFDFVLRNAENVTVLFNANLLEVEGNADQSHVTGLVCATIDNGSDGNRFRVEAGAYALAMGGIENVRMLKLSGDIGNNAKDHLGRGFMVHPLIENAARVTFNAPVPSEVRGFFRDQQVRLHRAEGDTTYRHMSAPLVNPELVFEYSVFNAWGVLVPTAETLSAEKIGNFRLILRFNDTYDGAIVNINWEQVPNEDSLISLNPSQTDPVFGQPVTHLNWRMLPEDKRTAVRALEICEAYLREQGAVSFESIADLSGGVEDWSFMPHEGALATGDHHMGAMRMSVSSDEGIVNPDSRLHTVDNLYAAGCAVFPTGGFANPTLTIVALALRLADHMESL